MTRRTALPPTLPPRGIDRAAAAEYVGVKVLEFDRLVESGAMPPPKNLDGRRVWDRLALDKAFAALPDEGSGVESEIWGKMSA